MTTYTATDVVVKVERRIEIDPEAMLRMRAIVMAERLKGKCDPYELSRRAREEWARGAPAR